MYPPGPILFRKVTQTYKMSDSGLILEKDLKVYIPIHAIHHDAEIYPDPETFDPERFSDQVKQSRHNYAYLPFGEGPRNCIGKFHWPAYSSTTAQLGCTLSSPVFFTVKIWTILILTMKITGCFSLGQRFGLLQMKLALAILLQNFEFQLGPEMPYPPIISKSAFLMTTQHGTNLRIKRKKPSLT